MIPDKRKIDLNDYARGGLLAAFKDRQLPCFSTTCNLEITGFKRLVSAHGYRFFIALSHLIARAVNGIPELRQRLIDGELYEFERVDPGYTILLDDDTFSFCDARYFEDFGEYCAHAARAIAAVQAHPDHSTGDKDHMFFITSIPWFSFTSFTHPYHAGYASIPIVTIGKYFKRGQRLYIPVAVQVHHGMVDGFHVGLFFEHLRRMLQNPQGAAGNDAAHGPKSRKKAKDRKKK